MHCWDLNQGPLTYEKKRMHYRDLNQGPQGPTDSSFRRTEVCPVLECMVAQSGHLLPTSIVLPLPSNFHFVYHLVIRSINESTRYACAQGRCSSPQKSSLKRLASRSRDGLSTVGSFRDSVRLHRSAHSEGM